jgi:hypothetical protein
MSASRTYTGLRKNRLSLKWKTAPVIPMVDATVVHGERLSVDPDTSTASPTNVVSLLENGTACVIVFPYTPEFTEAEWEKIDAAHRIRVFLYACSDAPLPSGQTGSGGKLEDYYPVASVRSAIDRSTYICSEILPARQRSRQDLIKALMNLAAKACSDDHRCALLCVTDRSFVGDDCALYRPSPATLC